MTMITRIDHVAISVHDFPAALVQYACLLGHAACAEAGEPGQRAALFALCNTYLLLLETASDNACGVSALGLAATDAHSCTARLQAQGIPLTALPDHPAGIQARAGSRTELWELSRGHSHGLTLRIVDRPETSLPAANSFSAGQVEALDHVVVRSAAMDQAQAFYGETLGMRLALDRELAGTRMLFFRTGGVTLEVIEERMPKEGGGDTFYGVAYRVRDLQAAHLRLTAAGFALTDPRPGRKSGTHVFSMRAAWGGIPTLFIRDASRD